MKSQRVLTLRCCSLCTVPAFVGELKSLEDLTVEGNKNLGNMSEDEAFPAGLRRTHLLGASIFWPLGRNHRALSTPQQARCLVETSAVAVNDTCLSTASKSREQ